MSKREMLLLAPQDWDDYALLDSGDGLRLERFGKYVLARPDNQAIWRPHLPARQWNEADAIFEKRGEDEGQGQWVFRTDIPERWQMRYHDLRFWVRPTPFKHTGIFPEQAVNWTWIAEQIKQAPQSQPSILNLFGYTGIATLAALAAGARVTHLDASRPALNWAHDNVLASGLEGKPLRWMLDDALKFTRREVRRGVRYDAIIMDPPAFGRGPKGEVWKFYTGFPALLDTCIEILSERPLFLLINAYSICASAVMLENMLAERMERFGGIVSAGELVLNEEGTGRIFSTGLFARWTQEE